VSHDLSEIILICGFGTQIILKCLKRVCYLIFLWKPHLIVILWWTFKRTAFIWN